MNPLRMSPATRRGHANRTLEKRNPPPRDYRSGGMWQAGAAGVWCPGMRGRIWSGAIFFHLPTMYSVCIRIAIHNVLYQLAA